RHTFSVPRGSGVRPESRRQLELLAGGRRRHTRHARVFSDSLLLSLEQTDERVVRDEPPTAELDGRDAPLPDVVVGPGEAEPQNLRDLHDRVDSDGRVFGRWGTRLGRLSPVVYRLAYNPCLQRLETRQHLAVQPQEGGHWVQ